MNLPPVDAAPAGHVPPDAERTYPRNTFQFRLLNGWLGGVQIDATQITQPLRFRLWELMVAMTVAAVLLALFRSLGIIGAAVAFVAALAVTQGLYPALNRDSPARQAAMFDFVWGAIMPIVCLTFDPFVFKYGDVPFFSEPLYGVSSPLLFRTASFYPWSWPVYAIVVWQVVCLAVWLVLGRLPAGIAGLWAGMLWVGFALSCLVGVALVLPALAGAMVGIGLMGFTPLFTARAFYRRALMAGTVATRELPVRRASGLALLGYGAALLLPSCAGFFVGAWILASQR